MLAHGRKGCLRNGEDGAHEGDRKAADCVVGYAFVYVVGLESLVCWVIAVTGIFLIVRNVKVQMADHSS